MSIALVVIDMQNAFLHPQGENFYACAPDVIAPALELITTARANRLLVVHVADIHRPGFTDFEQPKLPVHGIDGSFDASFFEGFGPDAKHREIKITKRRYSAFFGTDLALFLREQKVTTLILCGVKTNVCVRATAQDAFAHGFDVQVVKDAVNTNVDHLGNATLEDIQRYLGRVISIREALEALQ